MLWWIVAVAIVFAPPVYSWAGTDAEFSEANEEAVDQEADETAESEVEWLTFLNGRLKLGLTAEFLMHYADKADTGDQNSADMWDAYIATLGISLAWRPVDWAQVVLLGESEDHCRDGETVTNTLSEAFISLQDADFPLYLVAGKRTQPSIVLDDGMISGSLIEDLYEIVDTGVTLGLVTDIAGLDVSVTAYEGQAVIGQLVDFNTHEYADDRHLTGGQLSYILNLTLEPFDSLMEISAYYNSEPGDRRRNETIGGGITCIYEGFTANAGYVTALERESGENEARNLESTWLLGVAYEPLPRLYLAVRYERFDDDRQGQQDEVVRYRHLGGVNYDITDHVVLSLEYLHTEFELSDEGEAVGDLNEYQLQLAVEY